MYQQSLVIRRENGDERGACACVVSCVRMHCVMCSDHACARAVISLFALHRCCVSAVCHRTPLRDARTARRGARDVRTGPVHTTHHPPPPPTTHHTLHITHMARMLTLGVVRVYGRRWPSKRSWRTGAPRLSLC